MYLISALGLSSLALTGRRDARYRRVGWVLAICVQVVWLPYAITTRQWGFVPNSFVYGAIDVWNLWTASHRAVHPQRLTNPSPQEST